MHTKTKTIKHTRAAAVASLSLPQRTQRRHAFSLIKTKKVRSLNATAWLLTTQALDDKLSHQSLLELHWQVHVLEEGLLEAEVREL